MNEYVRHKAKYMHTAMFFYVLVISSIIFIHAIDLRI